METNAVHTGVDGFPVRLRKLRERRGMNRKALAECCGLSKNTIARYEKGEDEPKLSSFIALADHFNVTLDDLAGRK